MTDNRRRARTILVWLYGVWFLVTAALVGTLQYDEISFGLVFMLIGSPIGWGLGAAWVLIPIIAGMHAVRLIISAEYRRAVSRAFVPIFAVNAILFGVPISGAIRFASQYQSYARIADAASHGRCSDEDIKHWPLKPEFVDCTNPTLIVFDWGGLGSGWHGIIFDASDEITKPSRDRSAAWKQRDVGSVLSCSGTSASFGGHYYFAGGSLSASATECD